MTTMILTKTLSGSLLLKEKLQTKTQNNNQTYRQQYLYEIQTGCLGTLHGVQSLTALNRCDMLEFNIEVYLD